MSRLGTGWVLGCCWVLSGCSGESSPSATDAGVASGGASTGGGSGSGAVAGRSGSGGNSSGGNVGYGGSGGSTSGGGGGSSGSGNSGGASTDGGGPLCTTPGWCELLDTKIDDVCASSDGCWGVVAAWSGGVADTQRNRLVVWGGGHQDYYGNEVYALDLNAVKMLRLNEPSPPNTGGDCVETLSDGAPNSRHTYGGLAYIAHADQMFAFSGSLACNGGYFSDATWTLDLASMTWIQRDSGPTAVPGATSDYDPVTKKVYLHDLDELWSYDVDSDSYQLLESNNGEETDYHMTGVFDPGRKLWIMFGGGQVRVHTIGNGSAGPMQIWDSQTSGCGPLQNADYPGLAYYPDEKVLVGWAGNDEVYRFNPDTKTCTVKSYAGGPGPASGGYFGVTAGRFRYFPSLGVFGLVNAADQNAYTLRLD